MSYIEAPNCEAPGAVFQIEDEDDLASDTPNTATLPDSPKHSAEQKQRLLLDTAELAVGTAGCCGAACLIYCCLCCGMCHDEMAETHNRHTLWGRWCPI